MTKRNFSSVKYEKFKWPQAKRSWSFTRATKKKDRGCAEPCCDSHTFGPRWKCSFKLWMAQQCGASSWTYHKLSLHSFFLGFPKLHVEVWLFFVFSNFVWMLTIFLDPYNHDSLLSSQSINSQSTAWQPYLLATRVPCHTMSPIIYKLPCRTFLLWLLSSLVV